MNIVTLKVGAVYFKDGREPIRDSVVTELNGFLIIGKDENDMKPNWYNADIVDHLEEVTAVPDQKKKQKVYYF